MIMDAAVSAAAQTMIEIGSIAMALCLIGIGLSILAHYKGWNK